MFYYLNGEVTLMEGNLAVIDCGGVGYACHTTAYTLSKLRVGQQGKLFTYCYIREDAFDILASPRARSCAALSCFWASRVSVRRRRWPFCPPPRRSASRWRS